MFDTCSFHKQKTDIIKHWSEKNKYQKEDEKSNCDNIKNNRKISLIKIFFCIFILSLKYQKVLA